MRFTPAHAGNTHVNAEEAGSLEVHPRSRGEYLLTLHQTDPPNRVHPRSRGNTWTKTRKRGKARFIPLTREYHQFQQWHPPHSGSSPLTREYSSQHFGSCKWIGSSPLTRGILPVLIIFAHVFRFIPAHAGNTQRHTAKNLI